VWRRLCAPDWPSTAPSTGGPRLTGSITFMGICLQVTRSRSSMVLEALLFFQICTASCSVLAHHPPPASVLAPIITGGHLDLLVIDGLPGDRKIRIKQIQLEQDTGKSHHDMNPEYSYIDFNRAGAGLMEIVTLPDFRSSMEAGVFLRKLQALLRAVNSSDGNMEEGSFRCDVNVSIRQPGGTMGTRCEIKNLNSVKSVVNAIGKSSNFFAWVTCLDCYVVRGCRI